MSKIEVKKSIKISGGAYFAKTYILILFFLHLFISLGLLVFLVSPFFVLVSVQASSETSYYLWLIYFFFLSVFLGVSFLKLRSFILKESLDKLERMLKIIFIFLAVLSFFSLMYFSLAGLVFYGLGAYFYLNALNSIRSTKNSFLQGEDKPSLPNESPKDPLQSLVPYNNKYSLWSYYLGVIGMIPIFGIPFGIASFVFSKKGLDYIAENPGVGGEGHCRLGRGLSILGLILTAIFISLIRLLF